MQCVVNFPLNICSKYLERSHIRNKADDKANILQRAFLPNIVADRLNAKMPTCRDLCIQIRTEWVLEMGTSLNYFPNVQNNKFFFLLLLKLQLLIQTRQKVTYMLNFSEKKNQTMALLYFNCHNSIWRALIYESNINYSYLLKRLLKKKCN